MPATLATLPTEIIDLILNYLATGEGERYRISTPGGGLSSYATISRTWQVMIERRTFRTVNLDTARLKAAIASETLFNVATTGSTAVTDTAHRRFAALRNVTHKATLPLYDKSVWLVAETDAESTANNVAFTESVADLFKLLSWGNNNPKVDRHAGPKVHVSICAECESDSTYYDEMDPHQPSPPGFERRSCGRRFAFSYIDFVPDLLTTPLPRLDNVSWLHVGERGRHIHPAAAASIAAYLPRLTGAHFCLDDNDKLHSDRRRARRDAFARGLAHIPPSITHIDFHLDYSIGDHRYEPLKGLYASQADANANDLISAAVGEWARRTPYVHISGSFTHAFWDAVAGGRDNEAEDTGATVALTIKYMAASPAGQWLCDPPPLYWDDYYEKSFSSDSDYSEFYEGFDDPDHFPRFPAHEDLHNNRCRCVVKPLFWRAVLHAAAHAVARLPALEILRVTVPGMRAPAAEIVYDVKRRLLVFASHVIDPPTDENHKLIGPQPESLLIMPGIFEPDADTVELWRAATATQLGQCQGIAPVLWNSRCWDYQKKTLLSWLYRPLV